MRTAYRVAVLVLVVLGITSCAAGAPRNIQAQALVDAAYLSLGYSNKDGGVWVK